MFGLLAGAGILYARLPAAPHIEELPVEHLQAHATARAPLASLPPLTALRRASPAPAHNVYIALLDPTYSLGMTPVPFAQSTPLRAELESDTAGQSTTVATAEPEKVVPVSIVPKLVESVLLPPERPSEFGPPVARNVLLPPERPNTFQYGATHLRPMVRERVIAQANRTVVPPATETDHRSFFEKLFGAPRQLGAELAYAETESGILGNSRRIATRPVGAYDRWTAVYNIAAHTVYMPDGTRLEAHSGMGDKMDDPRFVSQRMQGATPPATYELEPRAQLFHGVRALRLIPIDANIYGRSGLLAHTFMLGPSGQSNGCVSFRNYNAFLQAYMDGEVKRLVVVAGR